MCVTKKSEKCGSNEVIALTEQTFEKFLTDNPLVMVKFYRPSCCHCNDLAPIYQKAAQTVKEKGLRYKLAEVNVEFETELADKYQVGGVPDMRAFRGLSAPEGIKYTGKRDVGAIIGFMQSLQCNQGSEVGIPPNKKGGKPAKPVKKDDCPQEEEKPTQGSTQGSAKDPKGTTKDPNGSAKDPKGTNKDPNGSAKDPKGTTKGPKGSAKDPKEKSTQECNKGKSAKEKSKDMSTQDGVVSLTEKTFDCFLKENPVTMVKFYKPGCCHCKDLAPLYEQAAKKLKDQCAEVKLAEVNIEVETKLGEKYKVKSVPHIVLFRGCETLEYTGKREVEDIVTFVMEHKNESKQPSVKDGKKEPSDVVPLTEKTFDKFIEENPVTMVKFYRPGCCHCTDFGPIYQEAAKKLKCSEIKLAEVNTAEETKLKDKFKIEGVPHVLIFSGCKPVEYTGKREVDEIVKCMLERKKEASSKPSGKDDKDKSVATEVIVLTEKNFDACIKDNCLVMVKFYKPWCRHCKDLAPEFEKAAVQLKEQCGEVKLAEVDVEVEKALGEKYKVKGVPHVIVFRGCETTTYNGNRVAEDIVKCMLDHKNQTGNKPEAKEQDSKSDVIALTEQTFDKFLEENPVTMVKFYDPECPHSQKLAPLYLEAAQKLKEQCAEVKLAEVDIKAEKALAEKFCIQEAPYLMVFRCPETIVYDGARTVDDIVAFMLEKAKDVQKEVPEKPCETNEEDKAAVTVLEPCNFAEIVNDESKDVLVEFYLPSCSWCKKLEPTYNKLAATLKKTDPNLLIAKMDSRVHPVPSPFCAKRFPTIYFVPSGKKCEPILYCGDRSMDDLIKFMKEHAVKSFEKKEEC